MLLLAVWNASEAPAAEVTTSLTVGPVVPAAAAAAAVWVNHMQWCAGQECCWQQQQQQWRRAYAIPRAAYDTKDNTSKVLPLLPAQPTASHLLLSMGWSGCQHSCCH
jgi:hypothetical protein